MRKSRKPRGSYRLAVGYLLLLGIVGLLAPILAREKPLIERANGTKVWAPVRFRSHTLHPQAAYCSPALCPQAANGGRHWLGTHHLGRDVAAGLLYGARTSIGIMICSVALLLLLGGGLGVAAAWLSPLSLPIGSSKNPRRFYFPLDELISRLADVISAVPGLLWCLCVAAIFPPSYWLMVAVFGGLGWVGIFRLVRARVLQIKASAWVEAAVTIGGSPTYILLRQVLPVLAPALAVELAFAAGGVLLAEATLSFLGVGLPVETVTWGKLLHYARAANGAWWILLPAGALIIITYFSLHTLAKGLQTHSPVSKPAKD